MSSGATEPERAARDQRYPAEMTTSATQFLAAAPIGIRVVARHRIPGGFTDALGYLRARDEDACTIETRSGIVTVPLADVVAAKQVPEPPARRPAR